MDDNTSGGLHAAGCEPVSLSLQSLPIHGRLTERPNPIEGDRKRNAGVCQPLALNAAVLCGCEPGHPRWLRPGVKRKSQQPLLLLLLLHDQGEIYNHDNRIMTTPLSIKL